MAPRTKAADVETTTVPPAETGTVPPAETTAPESAETRQESAPDPAAPESEPDAAEVAEPLRTVRMRAKISGTRNGVDWPEKGELIELPADEAQTLINHGQAEDTETETAETPVAEALTATAGRRSIKASLDKGAGEN
ncbi:hypothetical protein [Arthrobacter silvisoli]|uniref:hypothetical protein n=1 Tax=Arthrobacter silvisoli TaxID=2291022 RepID=UPI000E213204|nr:hypothetical protein [Arthrobacter silvisoli]